MSEQLRIYDEQEAVVDALAGHGKCRHGLWPHQGRCWLCNNGGTVTITGGCGGGSSGCGGAVTITGGRANGGCGGAASPNGIK